MGRPAMRATQKQEFYFDSVMKGETDHTSLIALVSHLAEVVVTVQAVEAPSEGVERTDGCPTATHMLAQNTKRSFAAQMLPPQRRSDSCRHVKPQP